MSAELSDVYIEAEEFDVWAIYEERKALIPVDVSPAEYYRRCEEIAEELEI